MDRREVLGFFPRHFSSCVLSASGLQTAVTRPAREYYQLRRTAQTGPQVAMTEKYISEALIPALAKRGCGPVGAFRLDIGPETPTYYVLIPSRLLQWQALLSLTSISMEIFEGCRPFWSAPGSSPAFQRMD